VRLAMEMVGLDFEGYKDRLTFTLSGGERRKAALASILAVQPHILLLDEPMAGMDPVSRKYLLEKFAGLKAGGLTLVLSSHYMDDVAELADQITAYHQGKDILAGTGEAVFSQGEQLRKLGLEPPAAYETAESLRARGWPIPTGITTEGALLEALQPLARAGAR